MRQIFRKRPSPAMVVAIAALVAGTTGTVVAATGGTKLIDKRIDKAIDLSSQSFSQGVSLTNDADFANVGTLNIKGPASSYMVTAFAQIDTSGCLGPANATARVTFDGQSFATYPDMGITVPPSALAPVILGGLIDPDSYGSKKHPYATKRKSHAIALLVKVTGGINQPQGCAEVAARNINAVRLSE
jgi:hypothetical protein